MIQARFFLGVVVSSSLERQIKELHPALAALLTQGGERDLEYFTDSAQLYLGKTIPKCVEIEEFEMLCKNVVTLLKNILANYSLSPSDLLIVAKN